MTTAAFLWKQQDVDVPRSEARRGRPHLWVIAALLAMLAGIVALSEPAWRGRALRVVVVVDASVSLAARHNGRTLRDELIARLQDEIANAGQEVQIRQRLAGLPDGQMRPINDGQTGPFTARPTDSAIADAITEGLGDSDAVIALTDRPIAVQDYRVGVLVPSAKPDNVGIDTAIAVERPRASLMVRIANDSDRREAMLEVCAHKSGAASALNPESAAGRSLSRTTIALPARGERRNYFIDLASPGDEIEVALLDMNDALPIDDTATLLRAAASPRLAVEAGAPEVAQRFAVAFHRAPRSTRDAGEVVVHLRSGREHDKSSAPQIIFAPPIGRAKTGDLRQGDHPILRGVDLASPLIESIAAAPPADWTPIASLGDVPVLAILESPVRAVWIGFDVDPTDVRSVILLANAVDWIADGSPGEWRAQTPAEIGADWRPKRLLDDELIASPGRYVDGDGREVSVHLPAVLRPAAQSQADIGEILRRVAGGTTVAVTKPLTIVAATLACIAAVLSGRRPVP